jgi:hypothetical protein
VDTFPTRESAVRAVAEVAGTGDQKRAEQIFGADGMEILRSGDIVADNEDAEQVKALIATKVAFEENEDGETVALFGASAWPFPIPLKREGNGWRFDVEAGKEEILNRRIGRNELATLATLHAVVDAQREYAAVARDGKVAAFAQRFFSSEGKKDGLYWPTADGEPESPLGRLVASAAADGYKKNGDAPEPFHGYQFRMLSAQGKAAPGGAHSYLDTNGAAVGGFAVIAWPAKYRNSGVMTFLTNDRGIVYQKDLGADTERLAAATTAFDPDATWSPARDQ